MTSYTGFPTGDPSGLGAGFVATGAPPAALTPQGRYIGALQIVRGTVALSYQALQYYLVSTDFGAIWAFYQGGSRGRLGALESGGFSVGQEVWVATTQQLPNLNSFIIGSAGYSVAGAYVSQGGLLVYPQVSGFALLQDTAETTSPTEDAEHTQGAPVRMAGQLYDLMPKVRNYNAGFQDATDGDWSMRNPYGGGVGVEQFRVFLQGGPMSGLYCYTEDGTTRLVGAQYQFITTGTEYDDYVDGVSIAEVNRRVYYPMDAVFENVPQLLEVSGPLYGGKQSFFSYRDKDNLNSAQGPGVANRQALIHEYRGLDGTYVLTAAASLTLQKTFNIKVPIEIIEPAGGTPDGTCEIPPPDYDTFQKPMDSGEVAATVAKDLRITNPDTSTRNPLVGAINARGAADRLIQWQARGGFDQLTQQWTQGANSQKLYGGGSTLEDVWNPSVTMWKCTPRTVEINLDSYGATKTIYLGRALIQIADDGSIVLQDAYGSQILMSGGNIVLQANHDVIRVAGRNDLTIAGRDVAVRADRHVDINSNAGRVVVAAAGELNLTGGHGGRGGVLIESKGDAEEVIDQGELTPGSAGGVIIRTPKLFAVDCAKAHVRARRSGWSARDDGGGAILLDAGDVVAWRAKNDAYYGSFGAAILAKVDGTSIMLGKTSYLDTLHTRGTHFYDLLAYRKTTQYAGYSTSTAAEKLADTLEALFDITNDAVTKLSVKFLRTTQYNLDSSQLFTIPEPEWQLRAKEVVDSTSAVLRAFMLDQPYDGTAPLPGSDAWDDYAVTFIDGSTGPVSRGLLKGV